MAWMPPRISQSVGRHRATLSRKIGRTRGRLGTTWNLCILARLKSARDGLTDEIIAVTGWIVRKARQATSLRRAPFQYPEGYDLHYRYSYDIGNVLVLRMAGFYADSGTVRWRATPALCCFLVLGAPPLLALILWATGVSEIPPGLMASHFGWLAYFSTLGLLSLILSRVGVHFMHHLTPLLGVSLTEKGRAAYDQWSDYATSFKIQFLVGSTVSIAALLALYVASATPQFDEVVYVSAASYLSIAVSGFFVGGAGYWIIAGTILSILITRDGDFDLSPFGPSRTPAIELLARVYRLAFYGASLGVGLALIPILSWAYAIPPTPQILLLKYVLFLLSLVSVLVVAIVPQWRLTRIVSDERHRLISELVGRLPDSPGSWNRDDYSEDHELLLEWLQAVSESRPSTVSETAFVGMLLAAAAALFPYAWQLLSGAQ